jgi:uncharacterized protein involved in response to NO
MPTRAADADQIKTRPVVSYLAEPFRLFFPAAVVAGLVGVLIWPLHFLGVVELYPGRNHARLMAHGFFGGFIFGFLGTAMPRMLSSFRLTAPEVLLFLVLHLLMVGALAIGAWLAADTLFLILLVGFFCSLLVRVWGRKDLPPPGFVLIFSRSFALPAVPCCPCWRSNSPMRSSGNS